MITSIYQSARAWLTTLVCAFAASSAAAQTESGDAHVVGTCGTFVCDHVVVPLTTDARVFVRAVDPARGPLRLDLTVSFGRDYFLSADGDTVATHAASLPGGTTVSVTVFVASGPPGPFELYVATAPGSNEGGTLGDDTDRTEHLDLGDIDTYAVPLSMGQTLLWTASRTVTPDYPTAEPLLQPRARLVGPDGRPVAEGNSTFNTYRAEVAGTYTLVVTDESGGTSGEHAATGDYRLVARRLVGTGTGSELLAGTPTNGGALGMGAIETHVFNGHAGDAARLSWHLPTPPNSAEVGMRLFSPSGVLLASRPGSSGGTDQIDLSLPETGVYTLAFAITRGLALPPNPPAALWELNLSISPPAPVSVPVPRWASALLAIALVSLGFARASAIRSRNHAPPH